MENKSSKKQTSSKARDMKIFILTCIIFFALWLVMSGHFTIKLMAMGLFSSICAAWVCVKVCRVPIVRDGQEVLISPFDVPMFKFIAYCFWLYKAIALSSIDLAKTVLKPKLEIQPCVFKFRHPFHNPAAAALLANSITLTPGTVTINVEDGGIFTIHALTTAAAKDLFDPDEDSESEMVRRVTDLYDEEHLQHLTVPEFVTGSYIDSPEQVEKVGGDNIWIQ